MSRTDTHVEWHSENGRDDLVFSGRVSVHTIAGLRLDHVDRAVLLSSVTNAADLFQRLEIIFRRMAEQSPSLTESQE